MSERKSYCTEERPCINCYTGQGECLDKPKDLVDCPCTDDLKEDNYQGGGERK